MAHFPFWRIPPEEVPEEILQILWQNIDFVKKFNKKD